MILVLRQPEDLVAVELADGGEVHVTAQNRDADGQICG
jgi:hypothetical protein